MGRNKVVIQVNLGREYYIDQDKIFTWCSQNFGAGFQNFGKGVRWKNDSEMMASRWSISINFGVQTYYFADEQDAILFSLKWVGTK